MNKELFYAAKPKVARRIVHIDLKGLSPAFPRLLELVELFKRMRFSGILMEWEDVFPWNCDPRFRAPHAYTPDQIQEFAGRCARLGLEVIPLVQSLGHSENVLRFNDHIKLREVPQRTDVFHPLHPESPRLITAMVRDVLTLLPETRYLHLGGDEVYTLGSHQDSRDFVKAHGIAALYLRQLSPTFDLLKQKGIRPLLWHDEVVTWEAEQIRQFAGLADFMVWGYTGDPRDPQTYHYRLPHLEKLKSLGCSLWGATAFKGADGPSANLPDIPSRSRATKAWAELTDSFSLKGVVCTGWSRYASGRIQVSPIEGALDSLLTAAVILHDGAPPEHPDALDKWLDQQPACKHFRSCRACLQKLSKATDEARDRIRQLEDQLAHLELEPQRADSGIEQMLLELLREDLRRADKAGRELEVLLAGKIAPRLPGLYRESRTRPIQAALERLEKHPCVSPSAIQGSIPQPQIV